MVAVTILPSTTAAPINPSWRTHARLTLIACFTLAFAVSAFSMWRVSGGIWLTSLQIIPSTIYALLITGEVAKVKHPLARDVARHPKRFSIPPRLFDGAPFSSLLTVFAILSVVMGIGFGIHSISAERTIAVAKMNLAAQISAAKDKANHDNLEATQYIQAHSPTPGEFAAATRLNLRSTASIEVQRRISGILPSIFLRVHHDSPHFGGRDHVLDQPATHQPPFQMASADRRPSPKRRRSLHGFSITDWEFPAFFFS
jgi:hypothetical protein